MNCKYLASMGKVRVHRVEHLTLMDKFSSPTCGARNDCNYARRILDCWKVEIAERSWAQARILAGKVGARLSDESSGEQDDSNIDLSYECKTKDRAHSRA